MKTTIKVDECFVRVFSVYCMRFILCCVLSLYVKSAATAVFVDQRDLFGSGQSWMQTFNQFIFRRNIFACLMRDELG